MTPDELQAIRERDAAMPEGYVFVPELVDRRTLLREYDALTTENAALRERAAESEHHRTKNRETAVRYQARLSAAEALLRRVPPQVTELYRDVLAFLTPADQPTYCKHLNFEPCRLCADEDAEHDRVMGELAAATSAQSEP